MSGARRRTSARFRARRGAEAGPPPWADEPDARLLDRRLSGLGLALARSPLQARVERLWGELAARGIDFRPHAWLSTDFFSPDGVPGVALPFYLAHPRLVRLERAQVCFAEGATERECLRLLRHEAGHAIDTAFALHSRADWRAAFGRRSTHYRQHFRVDPTSRDFVRYLPRWYAQSHPAEDFAETFAVWLDRGTRWRSRYAGWGALAKLELVDRLMAEVRKRRPLVRVREHTEAVSRSIDTLATHYRAKRRRYAREPAPPFAEELERIFRAERAGRCRSAAAYLRERRAELVARIVRSGSAGRGGRNARDRYGAEQVLDAMELRCRELGLRWHRAAEAPTLRALGRTASETLDAIRDGNHLLSR